MNAMPDPNKILTDVEVAKLLRLTPQTLRIRRMKKLPPRFYKIGGRVFYEEKDVIDFMKSCLREPVAEDKKED